MNEEEVSKACKKLEIPLLTISNPICMPGKAVEFEVVPGPNYDKLFQFVDEHSQGYIGIAYPQLENCTEISDEIFDHVTLLKLDYWEPVIRKGELWSYSLEASYSAKAKILKCHADLGFRLAKLVLDPDNMEQPSRRAAFHAVMKAWVNLRLLAGGLDSHFACFPARDNINFRTFWKNPKTLPDKVFMYLEGDYYDKIRYFMASSILEKVDAACSMVEKARLSGLRFEYAKTNYSGLLLDNPSCKISNN